MGTATIEREMRIQSMGWIITKIIHDVRNPLGSIELLSSLLRRELENDMDKQKLIDNILYSVHNIDNILSNLLNFTQFPKPKFKTVNLKDIIERSLDVLDYLIKNNRITIVYDISPDIYMTCDETLMKQVFTNLSLNSIHATMPGGCLTIKGVRENKNGDIEIWVKDNGSGIEPENLDRIFDPFFTTREKGSGIGLTIVHNIIKIHGGSIKAYSKLGEGALFIINLPEKRGQGAVGPEGAVLALSEAKTH